MEVWTPDQLKSRLDQGGKVFLKIWKKGCGACTLSIPAIERLEKNNIHGLTFAQICSDDHPEILEISDSEVLPAFYVFAEKKMLGKLFGFKGLAKLQEFVNTTLQSP